MRDDSGKALSCSDRRENGTETPQTVPRGTVSEMISPSDNTTGTFVDRQVGISSPTAPTRETNSVMLDTGFFGWWNSCRHHRESDDQTSNNPRRNHWLALLFGQAIALTAASMNASSYSLVYEYGLQTQLFQLFLVYILLACHLLLRPKPRSTNPGEYDAERIPVDDETTNSSHSISCLSWKIQLRIPWWKYLMMSIIDVVPNFFILFSYGYTSLTSTTILGSLTVPTTMLFSRLILKKIFHPHHYVGVLLCVLGGVMTIYTDSTNGDSSQTGKSEAFGDLLAVVAALMYGLGDAVAEYTVKNLDRFEYLGMLGLFGAIITGLTFPFVELKSLEGVFTKPTNNTGQVVAIYLWYILSVLLYYVLEARFLMSSDATMLNLSMQSVNIWAAVFSMTRYHGKGVSSLFWVALLLVFSGVFVYEIGWRCCCCWFDMQSCRFRGRRRMSEVEIVQATPESISYQSVSRTLD